ncbi:MAG: family hydrolase [Marmoricola sp.]|nr:family hydrolase [Marmoricola sp.]
MSGPLADSYDLAVLDLDGVVYIGASAVDGAVDALAAARAAGMHLAFVTNNAARSPQDVAAHLTRLGIHADPADVVTSAQAAARLVADEVPAGSAVYVIGGPGLHDALRERGLVPVTDLSTDAVAVVQGYGPDMPWHQVIDGALLVKRGLPWVATNTDLTVPTPHGPGPGNGTLVDLVSTFAGREPRVAGKPQPPLYEETLARVGGVRPLVVGDRLDTDIDGAHAVGWDSVLVMSGVTTLPDLASLPAPGRPTYVGADVGILTALGDGGWTGAVRENQLVIHGSGDLHGWWQAAASALWDHLDSGGQPATTTGCTPGSVNP